MDTRSAGLLEFDKILDILIEYCISEEGKRSLQSQQLFYSKEQLTEFQDMISQLRMLLESDEIFPVPCSIPLFASNISLTFPL